jgi:hypothetical protein
MISSIKIDKMAAKNFKETKVYKLAYEQAMEIFKTSKSFPSEEGYSLTDQIEQHPEVYVQILLKHTERKNTLPILCLK